MGPLMKGSNSLGPSLPLGMDCAILADICVKTKRQFISVSSRNEKEVWICVERLHVKHVH